MTLPVHCFAASCPIQGAAWSCSGPPTLSLQVLFVLLPSLLHSFTTSLFRAYAARKARQYRDDINTNCNLQTAVQCDTKQPIMYVCQAWKPTHLYIVMRINEYRGIENMQDD